LEDFRMTSRHNVLVVGGAGGIGAACCETLKNDWVPIVADIDATAARSVAEKVGGHAVQLDVNEVEELGPLLDCVESRYGAIDALVYGAALIPPPKSPAASTLEEWDRIFSVNIRGAYAVCRAVGTRMSARRRGSIVLIASLAGVISTPHTVYGPSKAAMLNLMTSLAVYWGRTGVRVNAVSPGPVRTPPIEASYARGERDPQELAKHTALGRIIMPAEVAVPIAFLLSEQASAITGSNLLVDAGMTAALSWNMFGGAEKLASSALPAEPAE
jgi:NAD(P)-dependent dehydrogenase (short-subunit alcohol dehydrogenase family)